MGDVQLARIDDQRTLPVMQFNRDQIELIKKTVARGATDDELALFLYQAKRTGLDPLTKQIHFVKRKTRLPDGSFGEVGAIQTGIDGFRTIADRTGKYGGQLGPLWCGKDGNWKDVWLSSEPPVAAKAGIIRTDFKEPIWAVARFEAYAQTGKDGMPVSLWRKMPDVMLAKCAEALALRKAFPQDISGVYAHEEMDQASYQATEEPPKLPPRQQQSESLPPARQQQPVNGQLVGAATEQQTRKVYAMSKSLGLETETMKQIILDRYGKEGSKELTKSEASDLIGYLNKLESGEETWPPVEFDDSDLASDLGVAFTQHGQEEQGRMPWD